MGGGLRSVAWCYLLVFWFWTDFVLQIEVAPTKMRMYGHVVVVAVVPAIFWLNFTSFSPVFKNITIQGKIVQCKKQIVKDLQAIKDWFQQVAKKL